MVAFVEPSMRRIRAKRTRLEEAGIGGALVVLVELRNHSNL